VNQSLAHIAIVVRNYDEAIAWYAGVLGFTLIADTYQPEQDKRWVLVAPPGAGDNAASLLLIHASTPEQEAFIGHQTGGEVFLFLKTDVLARLFGLQSSRRALHPSAAEEPAGTVAIFEDLYGKFWDLVQFAA
jgi:catechol 2,3-dioxygenase-like lactoylglutathione lyase family enzyme